MLLILTLIGLAAADDAWMTQDAVLVRWPAAVMEDAPTTARVDEGQKVEVVLRDGDQVRVKAVEDFGWVAADKVTDEDPEGEKGGEADEKPE